MKFGGFQKCLAVTLKYEGGWSNNKRDPGGVTLNGVIQRVDDAYRRNHGLAPRPLTAIMNGTAVWNKERDAIYRAQYWDAVRGDEVPAGIDMCLFDAAVHSGPFQSVKWLQRGLTAAGLYHDQIDGHFGEGTMDALKNHPDNDALVADICARRLGMMQHLDTWDTFGGGWTKRIVNVKAIGQAWATGSVGPQPIASHEDGGNAKAYASDVAQPAVDAGDAVKAGVGGGGLATVIDGAKDQIAPLAYSSDWLMKIFTALTVASVVIGIGALLYSLWAHRKTKRAQRAIDGDILADVPEGQPA
jgi:lysozyme family protein